MPIKVACPGCGKNLNAPDSAAGKRAKCPHCQTVVTVPRPEPVDPLGPQEADPLATVPGIASVEKLRAGPTEMSQTSAEDILAQMQGLGLSAGAANPLFQGTEWQSPALPTAAPPPFAPRARPSTRKSDDDDDDDAASPKPPPAIKRTPRKAAAKPTAGWAPSLNLRRFGWRYWLFSLTLVPLMFSLLSSDTDLMERLGRSLAEYPEAAQEAERDESTLDDVLAKLPDNRVAGAHLARDSWVHWFYASLAAGLFFALILALFQHGTAKPWHLLGVGLGTATGGILCLLIFQWIAMFSNYMRFTGGIVGLVLLIVKLIAFSYRAALDPDTGLIVSMLGFTFGVGLCEELVKAAPILMGLKNDDGKDGLDWRGACAWGLASGVGFGVAEGIMYSGDYYNGVQTIGIYFVRFVSCVGLHAIWAASVGIMVYYNQDLVSGDLDWGDWGLLMLKVQGVPMVLHGLYDTLLKKEYNAMALVVALLSFAWLAFLIARSTSDEGESAAPQMAR